MSSSEFIIAAHDVCDSCNGPSGPRFYLHPLRGPSQAHRTNETPKGAELPSRLDDIRDAQLEIDKFNTEIARVKENLKGLKQRRAEFVKYKSQEMSLFSPIRSLPDDVLKHIFLLCQGMEDKPGYIDFGIDGDTFVQKVTSVCNYWRNTALSMPVLWSRVSFAYSMDYMLVSPAEFLERCLTLSASAPFSLEVGEDCDLDKLFGEKGLKKLAEAAHRWEFITIDDEAEDKLSRQLSQRFLNFDSVMKYVPKDTIFSCLKELGPIKTSTPITFHSSPLLECVRLTGKDTTTSFSFPSAPLLRGVEAFGYCSNLYDVLPDFPWDQITHFACQASFVGNQLPTLLASMSSLYYLKLGLNDAIVLPASTDIMLPRLHTLLFPNQKPVLRDDLVVIDPLAFITAPSLKTLQVGGDRSSEVIISFIVRSQCNIERLTLPGNTVLGQWDIDELKPLKYLYVKWFDFRLQNDFAGVMDFLTLKTSGESPQNAFPQLQALKFYFPGMFVAEEVFPEDIFKAMIASRIPPETEHKTWKDNTGLKSVEVIFQFTQDMLTANLINNYFATLRESGVCAVIKYEGKDDIDSDDPASDLDDAGSSDSDTDMEDYETGTDSDESSESD